MTADYAATDPCPGAARVIPATGALPAAYQHVHPVTCAWCVRIIRYAWWLPQHACGPCQRDPDRRAAYEAAPVDQPTPWNKR